MKSPENQPITTDNHVSSDNASETEYWNSNTARKYEPVTQVQRDNVITRKSLPDIRLIIGLSLVIGAFLFVAAIYYGIINP